MPSQIEYQKVYTAIIEPMIRHFGADLDKVTIDEYVEDLRAYNESNLKSAMRKLRHECHRRPTMAQIIEACEFFRPTPKVDKWKKDKGFHPEGPQVQALMRSPIGQLAIRNEVGGDFWLLCWRDGKEDWSEQDIKRLVVHRLDAMRALQEARDKKNPALARWEGLWMSLEDRNADIKRKYFREAA